MTNGGSGYTSAPTISFGGPGSGASATAQIASVVNSGGTLTFNVGTLNPGASAKFIINAQVNGTGNPAGTHDTNLGTREAAKIGVVNGMGAQLGRQPRELRRTPGERLDPQGYHDSSRTNGFAVVEPQQEARSIPFDESNFPRVDRRSGPDLKPFAVGKKGLQWQRPIRIRPSLALVVLEPK